ncbi:MAG TPA: DNA-formamidopyrimidine glycosylase family protein [Polyangiaceae bacterium]
MPELPDIELYVEALSQRIVDCPLKSARIAHPFVLRSFEPKPEASFGQTVTRVFRMGKRIVIRMSNDHHWIIHLMIAGRLHWGKPNAPLAKRAGLFAIDFSSGTLSLTEAGTKRRASLHVLGNAEELAAFRRYGVEPLEVDAERFAASLRRESHTLKRALTDPDIVSGVGNAYSDEILHRARLSPMALTRTLDDEACQRLHAACQSTLAEWVSRLQAEAGGAFPERVTTFRPEMAVHGRYAEPCPVCGTKVQRIRYATNECNYCPTCQTQGRLLADRSLSRLLRKDWPRSLEELDEHRAARRSSGD